MNTLHLRRTLLVFVVTALAVTAMPLAAAPAIDGPVADVLLGTTQVQWAPRAEYAGLRLTISGPNGTEQFTFGPGESPLLDLASVVADIDGQYSWELRAAPIVDVQQIAAAAKAPGFAAGERQRPAGLPAAENLVQSGSFRVVGGAIVQPAVEGAPSLQVDGAGLDQLAGAAVTNVTGEQLITGDLTVQFSLCVGGDCAASESYGADTIRLKENNLRIHFSDTSNSASFPTNDWRIEANSSSNGGDSYLSIIDVDAARIPFRVDAGAPTNSLRVESTGDIGIGTGNPVVELHVTDGDSPTLRLEQNQSSGFAAQTWDVAGNETNFFVRDATNGSALPFRIFPGSGADDALIIAGDGDIGMGTTNPSALLHVKHNSNGGIFIETDGQATLKMDDTTQANTWQFFASNAFQFDNLSNVGVEFQVNPNGDAILLGTLTTNGPSCSTGCDRVFAPDFPLESIEAHAEYMFANSHLPAVGPTAPNAPFNVSEKTGGILNELEKAHIYIAQLNDRLKQRSDRVNELEQTKAELLRRLERLESVVLKD